MPENRMPCATGNGRETVCIETNRIFDSCRDRDCFENTRVFLNGLGREIIEHTGNVRVKRAEIVWTNITAEPVQFNHGFFAVDIRYFVRLVCEACVGPGRAQEFEGIAVLDKRVILYGGESHVNVFRSSGDGGFCSVPEPCCSERNAPDVVVEVVDPIVLDAKVVEPKQHCCCCCCACDIPDAVLTRVDGSIVDDDRDDGRHLAVSLGIFSVIRMVRPAQYLVQASEYAVPDKECVQPDSEDPCGAFRAMPFPANAFSPRGPGEPRTSDRSRCGC